MIELKRAQVETLLDEAVSKFGEDYVYPRNEEGQCHYVRDGAPSCLVGQVLAASGVSLERLMQADRTHGGSGTPATDLLYELKDERVLIFDLGSFDLLVSAQQHQDSRVPWGKAVHRAKTMASPLESW